MTTKKGGLTLPSNPGARLQDLTVKEGQKGETEDTTQPRTHATTQPTEVESVPATKSDSMNATAQPVTRESEVERLVATMKATTDATLNTRIPAAFKDWLDTQAFNGRHNGVTVRSQVVAAIEEYIARRLAEGG